MARSFLATRLAAGGELGDRAARRGFGHLAAGVGIDLGVEHQDVDVAAGGQHVIQAAVADVVGPAVAADDPDALFDQRVGQRRAGRGLRACSRSASFCLSIATRSRCAKMPASLFWSASSIAFDQFLADARQPRRTTSSRAYSFCLSMARRMPSPNSALSSNSELDQAGAAAFVVDGVRRGRQVAAVDRGAAGGVGDDGAVAEELASSA